MAAASAFPPFGSVPSAIVRLSVALPKWLATTYPQMYKPARMIQMDTLAHNLVDYDFQRSGLKLYAIDDPIPKAVLDGAIQSSPAQRFVVLTGLELLIRRET
jgi:hypothetical protein